jgi:PAS domain S-box-containing protein
VKIARKFARIRSTLDQAPISEQERLELERLRAEVTALRVAAGLPSTNGGPSSAREHANAHGLFGVTSEEMFAIHAPDGTITYASPECEELTGYAPDELEGRDTYDFFHPDDIRSVECVHREILENPSTPPRSIRMRLLTADGGAVWVESLVRGIVSPETGELTQIVAYTRNISDRFASEIELRESEERYRLLVEATHAIPWEADPSTWRFTYVGPRAERVFGYPASDWLKENFWRSHIHPDDREFALNFCMNQTAAGKDHEFDYRFIAADGSVRWVRDYVSLVMSGKTAIRMRGLLIDVTDQHEAAEDARRKDRSNAALLENVSGMAYRCQDDDDWTMELLSSGCTELTGYRVSDLLYNMKISFNEIIHPDDRERVHADWVAAVASGKLRTEIQYRIITAAGEIRWVLDRAQGIVGAHGRVIAVEGLIVDVTKQVMLQEEHDQFFAISPDYCCVADQLGKFLRVNPSFQRMLGWSDAELTASAYIDFVHEDDREGTLHASAQLAAGHPVVGFENRYRTRDNGWRWLQWNAYVSTDRKFIYATARDVTEAKSRAQREKDRLIEWRQVLELLPVGVWLVDASGELLIVNPAARAQWDLGEDDPIPDLDKFFVHAESAPEPYAFHDRPLMRALRNGESTLDKVIEFTGFAGTKHIVRSWAIPILDHLGEIRRALCVHQDITEERELRAQIVQTQKLESLGVLAGGVAHDFNNILTSILANANLAKRDLAAGSKAYVSVDAIEQASNRAAELCRQMLSYAGKSIITRSGVDVSSLIEEMRTLMRASVAKNVTLHFDLAKDLPPIEADISQIEQVVINLVGNSSEAFGMSPGEVFVSTGSIDESEEQDAANVLGDAASPGERVFIEVRDTGPGIDDEILSRVFDPFFTTKFSGRGLGLPVVLGIVRSHGGALTMDTKVGVGTRIRITLPVMGNTTRPDSRSRVVALPGKTSGRLLVVDDEESILMSVSRLMKREGYAVDTARNGQEGVRVFRESAEAYSAVLLDLTMPIMGGGEAFEAIRAIRPNMPILLMSGYSDEQVSVALSQGKSSGFLSKPFRVEELLDALHRILPKQSP